jgi:hypothetical protein
MEKHTPGPWEIQATESDHFITETSGNILAIVYDHYLPGRTLANARLIAAAPEMLKFIERLSNAHSQQELDTIYYECYDFIAKIKE